MEWLVVVVLAVWGFGILADIFSDGIKDALLKLLLIALGWLVIYWLVTGGLWTISNFGSE